MPIKTLLKTKVKSFFMWVEMMNAGFLKGFVNLVFAEAYKQVRCCAMPNKESNSTRVRRNDA